jgi:hypothetical protein
MLDVIYNDQKQYIMKEQAQMNKLNKQKHQNIKKLKSNEADINNLIVVQRSLQAKIE